MKPITTTSDEEREINIRLKNGGFLYKEAFCLMTYYCKACGAQMQIWNSRDGVTPFIVGCPDCGKDMRHIDWQHDKRIVDYIPKKGQYIFTDMPEEVHMIYMRMRVNSMWDNPDIPKPPEVKTKEDMVKMLQKGWDKKSPFLMMWR